MDTIIKNYTFEKFDELNWCYEKDIMYQRDMSISVPYDENYYKKYLRYENTDISKKLNNGRANITQKYCCSLLDIGVGSGEFIKNSKIKVRGYDINPIAVEWLKLENIFLDPYKEKIDVDGLCFWDSLEHIKDPNLKKKLSPLKVCPGPTNLLLSKVTFGSKKSEFVLFSKI